MNVARNPATVHAPIAAYVHQFEIREPARVLLLSGQIGQRLDGSVPDDPIDQIAVAWDNLEHNLHAAEIEVADIVKRTIGTKRPILRPLDDDEQQE
jgi:2-iminobutanoate/2-iminopropanoate deaminase